jgi:hypothetical protein
MAMLATTIRMYSLPLHPRAGKLSALASRCITRPPLYVRFVESHVLPIDRAVKRKPAQGGTRAKD